MSTKLWLSVVSFTVALFTVLAFGLIVAVQHNPPAVAPHVVVVTMPSGQRVGCVVAGGGIDCDWINAKGKT